MIKATTRPRFAANPICRHAFALLLLTGAVPAGAQQESGGRVATSSVGEVGQRQKKERAVIGAKPMARIDSRIQNRVQSRIYNRIDRYYIPHTDSTSAFEDASDKAQSIAKPH